MFHQQKLHGIQSNEREKTIKNELMTFMEILIQFLPVFYCFSSHQVLIETHIFIRKSSKHSRFNPQKVEDISISLTTITNSK